MLDRNTVYRFAIASVGVLLLLAACKDGAVPDHDHKHEHEHEHEPTHTHESPPDHDTTHTHPVTHSHEDVADHTHPELTHTHTYRPGLIEHTVEIPYTDFLPSQAGGDWYVSVNLEGIPADWIERGEISAYTSILSGSGELLPLPISFPVYPGLLTIWLAVQFNPHGFTLYYAVTGSSRPDTLPSAPEFLESLHGKGPMTVRVVYDPGRAATD